MNKKLTLKVNSVKMYILLSVFFLITPQYLLSKETTIIDNGLYKLSDLFYLTWAVSYLLIPLIYGFVVYRIYTSHQFLKSLFLSICLTIPLFIIVRNLFFYEKSCNHGTYMFGACDPNVTELEFAFNTILFFILVFLSVNLMLWLIGLIGQFIAKLFLYFKNRR